MTLYVALSRPKEGRSAAHALTRSLGGQVLGE